ncbi:MAG: menaquinone biosynthesis decarboxylase [Bacteroidetes bacterium]|nr:MAG: menaquinone biosynthesis decarboxylase [Bacteroidota bacterium]
MAYKSLKHFISSLESSGELVRIKEFVSPKLEITEITDRISKRNGPALLFENTGTGFPLLINAMGSERRICMALGVEKLDDVGLDMAGILEAFLSPKERLLDKMRTLPLIRELASWMPKRMRRKGACQEVIMERPDLTTLPVLTCWPADGGPFITLPCVHTISPQLAVGSLHSPPHHLTTLPPVRNLGMYRMQVFGPDLAGMHWHLHKGSANHYRKYKNLGIRMPVSVTLGGDPVYTYVATAPLPENLDEYLLAGFLRKKKVELVRCLTNNLEVPGDVDFVIEGYVDPTEELILEGPFGDHTGFYSLSDLFPRFHVTCITHRKDAVYPATVVGIPPQEDGWIGKATERIFLTPLKISVVPELADLHMPVQGVFHNLVLASIEKRYPGQAEKVMHALWGAGQMMFNKILVVTDPEVNLTDYRAVAQAVSDHVNPQDNILFTRGPVDILDHSSREYASGSKMGIDATRKDTGSRMPDAGYRGAVVPWCGSDCQLPTANCELPTADCQLLLRIPDLVAINDALLKEGIGVLIISFRKSTPGHARSLAGTILETGLPEEVKFIVLVEEPVDPMDLATVVWLGSNNIDPERDCFFLEGTGDQPPVLFLDATRKSPELDGFRREWPNVIVMDDATIRTIDEKWPALGLGPIIPSPSTRYKSLVFRDGPLY